MDKSNGRASKRKQVRNSKRDDELDKIFRSFIEGVKDVIEDFVSKITTCWYRSTKAIFDTATICAQADEQLNPAQKKKLLKRLPFGQSTFSQLVQISKERRTPPIMRRLPPSMSNPPLDEDSWIKRKKHTSSAQSRPRRYRAAPQAARRTPPLGPRSPPMISTTHSTTTRSSFTRQEDPKASVQGDDAYDAAVGEMTGTGFRRADRQALTKELEEAADRRGSAWRTRRSRPAWPRRRRPPGRSLAEKNNALRPRRCLQHPLKW